MDRFHETKTRIKDAVDLVQWVGQKVRLQPRGRYLVGLCPFHQEKTPSFTVYTDSQNYRCYGCGQSGDVIDWVMEQEGLSFREAMEILADQAGVSLEGVFRGGGRGDDAGKGRQEAYKALAHLRDWFQQVLLSDEGAAARDYLGRRGLLSMVEPFGIGFHPRPSGALLHFAEKRGIDPEVLQQAGLLRDGRRELFAGRVLFPIQDERGRVVGFGGRVLPGQERPGAPKYLNSPESPLFNKRRILFGLRQAKDAGERRIVVTEGYTDVIACHRAGLAGAVATLGTALTRDHARLLERYARDGLVLLFDGDRAGRQAADRAFRELVHSDLPTRIALLPEGQDPADLIGDGSDDETGRRAFEEVVDGAEDALMTWFDLMGERMDLGQDANVQRACAECGRVLSGIENIARREALTRSMAQRLGLSVQALEQGIQVRPDRAPAPRQEAAASPEGESQGPSHGEEDSLLLAGLLREPELLAEVDFETWSEPVRRFGEWIAAAPEARRQDESLLCRELFARCNEHPELRALLDDAREVARRIREPRGIVLRLRAERQANYAKQKASELRRQLDSARAAGNRPLADQLTRQYMETMRAIAPQEN